MKYTFVFVILLCVILASCSKESNLQNDYLFQAKSFAISKSGKAYVVKGNGFVPTNVPKRFADNQFDSLDYQDFFIENPAYLGFDFISADSVNLKWNDFPGAIDFIFPYTLTGSEISINSLNQLGASSNFVMEYNSEKKEILFPIVEAMKFSTNYKGNTFLNDAKSKIGGSAQLDFVFKELDTEIKELDTVILLYHTVTYR
jgi:hypothetical protein